MKYDAGWLISVFSLAIAMTSLWMLSRARELWRRDSSLIRERVDQCQKACTEDVGHLRQSLSSIETGMVASRESLREGRLNLSVRAQALQMVRSGARPEAIAGNLGMALSEARLLTRVSQILAVKPESPSAP